MDYIFDLQAFQQRRDLTNEDGAYWDATRQEVEAAYALGERDFARINLSKQNLESIRLFKVSMWKANLSEVNLTSARLDDSSMWDTSFEGADLKGASFSNVSLNGANLRNTCLSHTHFYGARLHEADFTDCDLRAVIFGSAGLHKVIGIHSVGGVGSKREMLYAQVKYGGIVVVSEESPIIHYAYVSKEHARDFIAKTYPEQDQDAYYDAFQYLARWGKRELERLAAGKE